MNWQPDQASQKQVKVKVVFRRNVCALKTATALIRLAQRRRRGGQSSDRQTIAVRPDYPVTEAAPRRTLAVNQRPIEEKQELTV